MIVLTYFLHIFIYLLVIGLADVLLIFAINAEADCSNKFFKNLLRAFILVCCYYILKVFFICAFEPHECFDITREIVNDKERIVYYNVFQTDSVEVYVNKPDTLRITNFEKIKEGEESVRANITCSDGHVIKDIRFRKDRYNNSRNKYSVIKTYWPKVEYEIIYYVD